MHEPDRRVDHRVGEVEEIGAQLLRRQHALVDHRPRGQRGDVEVLDRVLDPLSQDEGEAVELDARLSMRLY